MAVLFLNFLDQIRPKWIKLANSVNRHLEFNSSPKGLISSTYKKECNLEILGMYRKMTMLFQK